jgi:hypothetical protein
MAGLDRGGSGDNRRFIQRITLFEICWAKPRFLFPVQMVTADAGQHGGGDVRLQKPLVSFRAPLKR